MKSARKKASSDNPFLELTWIDIQDWAGSKILSRGKSYQRSGQVEELGITKKNEIVAWVEGSTRYATKAFYKLGKLSSVCTCPYKTDCKHGVAAVIEYLESMKKKNPVPLVSANDKRIALIKQGMTALPKDFDDDRDEEPEENDDSSDMFSDKNNSIAAFLNGKSHAELALILTEIAENHPEVKNELQFKSRLSSPSAAALSKTISKEIDKVSDEPGWHSHWEDSRFTPDYSRVKSGLQKLFDSGNFDEIVKLGKKIYSRGMEQTGQSDDEGETIQEIIATLDLVYLALQRCSLPDVDKMEQAIDWELADEYSLSDGLEKFWKKSFSKNDWSTTAERLLRRLTDLHFVNDSSEFVQNYNRDKLTDQIIKALDLADRADEVLNICIQEAPITGSFDRLVTKLRKTGMFNEAEEWIRKGLKVTREKLPGIASRLREHLLDIHNEKRDWPFSAAIKADDFFEHPSIIGYTELKKACDKAMVWNEARSQVILFLNTGKRPKSGNPGWTLPDTGIATTSRGGYLHPPFTTNLIEIALLEKDIDEALRLYDEDQHKSKGQSFFGFGLGSNISEQIAEAVKEKYPDRSIAIWKKIAESHIDRTNPKEYSIALGYLNRIQKVMKKNGNDNDFKEYIADIKEQNKRKIRLIEMLDSLTGKRIID